VGEGWPTSSSCQSARLHDVFHVGMLKKFHSNPPMGPGQLPLVKHGRACVKPKEVIKSWLARGCRKLLVKWKGHSATNLSWLDIDEFWSLYPAFELADKLILQGGRDVMWHQVYSRCGNREQGTAKATTDSEEGGATTPVS
jgi:hypothetical protein